LPNPSQYRYVDEFIRFSYGKITPLTTIKSLLKLISIRKPGLPFAATVADALTRNKGNPVIIMQHDADNIPSRTLNVMRLEQKNNLTSSNYFFSEHAENEDYSYDISALKELENQGFEIGYHLNAFERANYDITRAKALVNHDLAKLGKDFNITSYVPHGGLAGKDGINNDNYPHIGALKDLLWAYNGKCILKEYTWSDGGVRTNKHIPIDPRQFVTQLKQGTRAVMLMHPQYYGESLRPDWETLNISNQKWWRKLWGL
jgi:hypothetical protein